MFGWMSANTKTNRRIAEMSGAFDGGASGTSSGILSGMYVATTMGWRPVESLAVGDMVLTFDAGLQPITQITRKPVWNGYTTAPDVYWPLHIPAGALGNRLALDVLPHQYVMIESDAGEELFGDPFSLIKAEALEGVNGIEARPAAMEAEAIVLHFESEQVVFDRSGVLYYSPSSLGLTGVVDPAYSALDDHDADCLVAYIESDAQMSHLCVGDVQPEVFAAA